ncbi:MAG: hypothetical protein EZS26_003479 [Candidatus Ordinivivax streblomastigis]|uniref:Uncharacterized protein n=1 Tax=Candidatus Ordinivivax streblomastigis TaxID=2540710 RepID=A0A5M8NTK9_9BACT|nr:MAG: hypothetical protein EZS26_003479 [Candidatus Ordinivivax streblomastigis]
MTTSQKSCNFVVMKIQITLHCPDCQSTKIKKNGRKSSRKQNYYSITYKHLIWRFFISILVLYKTAYFVKHHRTMYLYDSKDESTNYYCSWKHHVLSSPDLIHWDIARHRFFQKETMTRFLSPMLIAAWNDEIN